MTLVEGHFPTALYGVSVLIAMLMHAVTNVTKAVVDILSQEKYSIPDVQFVGRQQD